MSALLPFGVLVLLTCGLYLLQQRAIVRLVLGITLLSHGAHLLILLSSRPQLGAAPLIHDGSDALQPPWNDPLPQALILTAIVISFGVFALLTALAAKASASFGADLHQYRDEEEQ